MGFGGVGSAVVGCNLNPCRYRFSEFEKEVRAARRKLVDMEQRVILMLGYHLTVRSCVMLVTYLSQYTNMTFDLFQKQTFVKRAPVSTEIRYPRTWKLKESVQPTG